MYYRKQKKFISLWLVLFFLFSGISCTTFKRVERDSLQEEKSPTPTEPQKPQAIAVAPPTATPENKPEPIPTTTHTQTESKFEWAVQAFEAGEYNEALERFLNLQTEGSVSPNFHLIPYYLGVIYLKKAESSLAAPNLEKFIEHNPKHRLAQEARILLLRSYSALREWKKIITMAHETSYLETYGGRKILVGLLWTEALIELKELIGAEKILRETKNIFRAIPEGSMLGDSTYESIAHLEDRAFWLESSLSIQNCIALAPPSPENLKVKSRKPMLEWLQKRGKCLHQSIETALPTFTRLSPEWNQAMTNTLLLGIENFANISEILTQNQILPVAKAKEFARPVIRKHFYQMIDTVRRSEKYASVPSPSTPPHERIIRKIESFLQKIVIESSSSGHTL